MYVFCSKALEGVNVTVVVFDVALSLVLIVPETALLELSITVKVLLVIVELSIISLKVAEMLDTSVVVPFEGEVEEFLSMVEEFADEIKAASSDFEVGVVNTNKPGFSKIITMANITDEERFQEILEQLHACVGRMGEVAANNKKAA